MAYEDMNDSVESLPALTICGGISSAPRMGSELNNGDKPEVIEGKESRDFIFGPESTSFFDSLMIHNPAIIISSNPSISPSIILNLSLAEACIGHEVYWNTDNPDRDNEASKSIIGEVRKLDLCPLSLKKQETIFNRRHPVRPDGLGIMHTITASAAGETEGYCITAFIALAELCDSTAIEQYISSQRSKLDGLDKKYRIFFVLPRCLSPVEAADIVRNTQVPVLVCKNDSQKIICNMFDSSGVADGVCARFEILLGQNHKFAFVSAMRMRFQDYEQAEVEHVNAVPGDFPSEAEVSMPPPVRCVEPRRLPSSGFVPVLRQVFESPPFQNRDYECIYWLLDLHQLAEIKDTTRQSFKSKLPVKLRRGELYTSYRFLAERWNCSTNKVATFLKKTKNYGFTDTRNETDGTVITICGYGTNSNRIPADAAQDETDFETQTETDSKRTRDVGETRMRQIQ